MRIAIVTASNSDEILSRNLLRSPLLQSLSVELHVECDPPSAAAAYNRGLDATTAEIVVFAHHDVFLPAGWDALLAERIAEVERQDPEWGLIGAFGIGLDEQEYGPVWSSSIGRIIGRVSLEPVPAQSYDELLIVMRRGAGLRFDEAMPWFHFYGTDIVQTARRAGRSAWIAALPVVHNDRAHGQLGADYREAYHALRRKWRAQLPLRTSTVKVSWHGLHLVRALRHLDSVSDAVRAQAVSHETDPERYAAFCGWRNLGSDTPPEEEAAPPAARPRRLSQA